MSHEHEDVKNLVSPFRIAFRVEGMFVNAYLAHPDTMEDAQLIGSCAKSILDVGPSQFHMFREIMQVGIGAFVKATLGVEVAKFDTGPAPEHEKAGNA